MSVLITEFKTVHRPLLRYARQMGWGLVPREKALTFRKGPTGKIFYNLLKDSLIKLNSGFLNESHAQNIIQRIDNIPDTFEGNKEFLDWIRGHKTIFDEKEGRERNVSLIDFKKPENNAFQVTEEWSYSNDYKTNRADIMFLINGIPLAVVENKSPKIKNSMENAIVQLRRCERETPEMLSFSQVFNITDALYYFYGVTWNYSRKGIFNWKKEIKGNRTKEIDLETAVSTFFDKPHFLKLIKEWVLFYIKDNELQKTILKQHQTRAIEKVIDRCSDASKKRGLIWHTQGSGKTFTMITAAWLILEAYQNATVMMIIDRNELEGQLDTWIKRIIEDLKTSNVPIETAYSKKELKRILKKDFRGLIVSMIHKFHNISANICDRKDFYIFIDEAHRSIEGDLGNYLTGALPNATIIGFTGTPVDKTEKGKGTFKIFGQNDSQGYLDKYSISESIDDGTTVPLKHSLAPNELCLKNDLLEKEFLELAETEGISDIETLNRILKRSVKLRAFLKSQDRIDKISKFVSEHFKQKVEPLGYKAFLVAVDREACALYKKALDQCLPEKFSKVIYTKGPNDSNLLREYQLSPDQELMHRKNFIKSNQNPKILIVTDKLLTGFDAPILYCMYLDKPMRDHVLLQAIARINRPYEDSKGGQKTCGLVVDFIGIFRSMKKALSFDSDEVHSVIEDLDNLMENFKSLMDNEVQSYLSSKNQQSDKLLEKLVYETFSDSEERKKFIELFEKLQSLYEILSPDPELRPYIDNYKKIAELYQVLRNLYGKNQTDFIFDICNKTRKLIQDQTSISSFSGITKTYELNTETLKKLKEKSDEVSENKKLIDLVKSIQKEADKNKKEEPYLLSIAEKAQSIMDSFIEKQKNSKEALEEVLKLIEDKISIQKQREQSPLSSQEFTVSWVLKKQNITKTQELSIEVSKIFDKFSNFQNNLEDERLLKIDIYQILSKHIAIEKLMGVVKEMMQLIGEIKNENR